MKFFSCFQKYERIILLRRKWLPERLRLFTAIHNIRPIAYGGPHVKFRGGPHLPLPWHWLLVCHTNTDPMRISLVFKKIILAIFGQGCHRRKFSFFQPFRPKIPMGQVFCFFLVTFGQSYQRCKFCFSWSFLAKDNNGESFWFRALLAKDTHGESFVFSWSYLGKVTEDVNFCFSWSFLAKDNNGESFWFWAFLAKDTNGESFVFSWSYLGKVTKDVSFGFSWSFLAKVTNGERFCFSWKLLAKVTFIGHFGYEYQWWKLCLWFEILSNLWHPALPNASSR